MSKAAPNARSDAIANSACRARRRACWILYIGPSSGACSIDRFGAHHIAFSGEVDAVSPQKSRHATKRASGGLCRHDLTCFNPCTKTSMRGGDYQMPTWIMRALAVLRLLCALAVGEARADWPDRP